MMMTSRPTARSVGVDRRMLLGERGGGDAGGLKKLVLGDDNVDKTLCYGICLCLCIFFVIVCYGVGAGQGGEMTLDAADTVDSATDGD